MAPLRPEVKLLLASILPGERASVQKSVGDLAKLPLYRVQAVVDAQTATFSGDVQIRYPTGTGITELPLRVFTNAAYIAHGTPCSDCGERELPRSGLHALAAGRCDAPGGHVQPTTARLTRSRG